MSTSDQLFDQSNSTEGTNTNDNSGSATIDNYLTELVGEGKQFQDAEGLAKGKFHSDQHINRLEGELQGLRDELSKRLTMEEFVSQINEQRDSSQTAQGSGEGAPNTAQQSEHTSLNPDDIQSLVRGIINQETEQNSRKANVEYVENKLKETLGPNFASELVKKSQELGVDKAFLGNMAETHPDAFLKLVGVSSNEKPSTPINTHVPPQTQVNTTNSDGSVRDFKYYEKLRKADPVGYFKPEVQRQMYKDAEALGDRFNA